MLQMYYLDNFDSFDYYLFKSCIKLGINTNLLYVDNIVASFETVLYKDLSINQILDVLQL